MKKIFAVVLLSLAVFFGGFGVCASAESDGGASSSASDEGFSPKWIFISIGGGIVIGFVTSGSMKAQLKSVSEQKTARNYIKKNSLSITVSNDIYLYTKLEKTERDHNKE